MIGGFESRQGLGIFLFITTSRPALGPTQPVQWVPGALSLGVKRPGREDHSPPSSAEVKNARSYTFTPQYTFMASCSVKAQGQLYFTLTYLTSNSNIIHKGKDIPTSLLTVSVVCSSPVTQLFVCLRYYFLHTLTFPVSSHYNLRELL
jgi:hypothetical protein